MKQEVNAADVRAMNRDGIIYAILLAATIIPVSYTHLRAVPAL